MFFVVVRLTNRMTLEQFTSQVLPLKNKIFRFAKRLLTAQMEAEDVTQDVFVKLWTKKETLQNYRSVEALAMTITRNACLDKLKSNKRRRADDIEDAHTASGEASPQQRAEMSDHVTLAKQIIDRLPEKQKMIVQLRDIEGYEFKEIEEITGISVNAIKVNLSRARQKIRQELTNAFEYGLKAD